MNIYDQAVEIIENGNKCRYELKRIDDFKHDRILLFMITKFKYSSEYYTFSVNNERDENIPDKPTEYDILSRHSIVDLFEYIAGMKNGKHWLQLSFTVDPTDLSTVKLAHVNAFDVDRLGFYYDLHEMLHSGFFSKVWVSAGSQRNNEINIEYVVNANSYITTENDVIGNTDLIQNFIKILYLYKNLYSDLNCKIIDESEYKNQIFGTPEFDDFKTEVMRIFDNN